MPYRFLDEEAPADVAFEAWGTSLSEVFCAASDATINVMVRNVDAIQSREARLIQSDNEELDMLLFDLLQRLIYFKDAHQLLLRVTEANVDKRRQAWFLNATAQGEALDHSRHEQGVDVKAVTLHQFSLAQREGLWRAHVILDI